MPGLNRKSIGHVAPFGSPGSSSLDQSFSQDGIAENDDAAEKTARRKSRRFSGVERDAAQGSPFGKKSKKALEGRNLSHDQLADHYMDCIKLSSENKISKGNAFSLNLIDYMRDILHKNGTNFQMASASLDASAKIYSCRVMNVWDKTNQMMVNLVSSNKTRPSGVDSGVIDDDAASETMDDAAAQTGAGDEAKKRKKKMRKGKTIETNLNNIRVSRFDFESNFEKEPLFQILSETFDSGTGGLLLNHLHSFDDSNSFLLDSNAPRDLAAERAAAAEAVDRSFCVSLDLLETSSLSDRLICPSLKDFKFGRDGDGDVDASILESVKNPAADKYAFDMDAEPEPADVAPADDLGCVDDDVDVEDDDRGMEEDPALDIRVGKNDMQYNMGSGVDGNETQSVTNLDLLSETLVTSMDQLSEFSYFREDKLRLLAGPDHWKRLVAKRKGSQTELQSKRKEKKAFNLMYDEEPIKCVEGKRVPPDNLDMWDNALKKSRSATEKSLPTLRKWREDEKKNEREFLLKERDLKDFGLNLRKDLFHHRGRRLPHATADVDSGVGDYNYDNAADGNFVPAINTSGGKPGDYEDDDNADDDYAAAVDAYADFEDPIGNLEEIAGPSQAGFGAAFTQENLIAAPSQVAALDIPYAKQAKKIDIKRLKATFWRILTQSGDSTLDTTTTSTPEAVRKPSKEAMGVHLFREAMEQAKSMLPPSMASNLSVPLAFVSMLYVTNEKNLKIEGQENLRDFALSQDHPPNQA